MSANWINCVTANATIVDTVKHGEWIRVSGYVTPGGDPVWRCSVCGKGLHVYGIEHNSYGSDIADHQWVACPNCGAKMDADHIAEDGKKVVEE